MQIRALREADERSAFRCGDPDLDRFFLRLARLAVDETVQGQGLGAVDFHAKHGFIALDAVHGQSDARPRPTAMFLAMRAIREAASGR
ncbi:MAG: hypothetical protein O2979_11830 [Proteobacteria bacterium]|nr:hypothetical protein [Pseudomonadota bacterium]